MSSDRHMAGAEGNATPASRSACRTCCGGRPAGRCSRQGTSRGQCIPGIEPMAYSATITGPAACPSAADAVLLSRSQLALIRPGHPAGGSQFPGRQNRSGQANTAALVKQFLIACARIGRDRIPPAGDLGARPELSRRGTRSPAA